jgi:hypothetical protein
MPVVFVVHLCRGAVCAITGCCSVCGNKLEAIVDTMANQMLRGFVQEMDMCDMACPKRRYLTKESHDDSVVRRRINFEDGQLQGDLPEDRHVRQLQESAPAVDIIPCLEAFYNYLPLSPDTAFESLMSCFVQGVQEHSVAVAEIRAEEEKATTEAPTSSPKTESPTSAPVEETESPTASPLTTDEDADSTAQSGASGTFMAAGLVMGIVWVSSCSNL